jgi:hypothetical protein
MERAMHTTCWILREDILFPLCCYGADPSLLLKEEKLNEFPVALTASLHELAVARQDGGTAGRGLAAATGYRHLDQY